MIKLKEVITKYPECLESASKLRSYLVDLYSEEKARIRVIVDSYDCGIYEKIKSVDNADKLFLNGLYNTLEKDYGYSHAISEWCINQWLNVLGKQVERQLDNALGCDELESEKTIQKFSVGLGISNNELYSIGNCKDLDIIIPNGVTRIGLRAFAGCNKIKSILIPDSVTSIGNYAFSNCSSLTDINLPYGLKIIGQNAFEHCSRLKSVNIPDSVTSIEEFAFNFCWDLPIINIPDSVTNIGVYAFSSCNNLTSVKV